MRVQYLKQYLSTCCQGDHDGYLIIIKLVPTMSLVVDNQKWKQLMAGKTEVHRQYTHVRTYVHTYIHQNVSCKIHGCTYYMLVYEVTHDIQPIPSLQQMCVHMYMFSVFSQPDSSLRDILLRQRAHTSLAHVSQFAYCMCMVRHLPHTCVCAFTLYLIHHHLKQPN